MSMSSRIMTGHEREVLDDALEQARMSLATKVDGLTETEARRRMTASLTTPIGLIKHAGVVERYWFQHFWAGRDESECDGSITAGDASFVVGPEEILAEVISEFRRAVQISRTITAVSDLSDIRSHPRYGPMQLRFVYVRLIAEYSRHAGHADILREQIRDS